MDRYDERLRERDLQFAKARLESSILIGAELTWTKGVPMNFTPVPIPAEPVYKSGVLFLSTPVLIYLANERNRL